MKMILRDTISHKVVTQALGEVYKKLPEQKETETQKKVPKRILTKQVDQLNITAARRS